MGLLKVLLTLALILLSLIFVLQNLDSVEVSYLGLVGIKMPMAFLVVILLVFGMVIGWALATFRRRRRKK